MNVKAWCLGAALGFLVAIVPSCGMPTGNCGANNCTGCCNAGVCVLPDKLTDSACGSAGNACSNCAASNQTCNVSTKSCIGASGTGGGSASTGGGTASTGGGTASTGGGTASTGGGSSGTGGGMAALMNCDLATAPTCPTGTECILSDVNGSAGKCVPGACSVLQQNCPGANTKCMVSPMSDGGFERTCAAFALGDGGVAEGANCTPAIPDPCQRGAQCIGIQGQPAPTCRRYCGISDGLTFPCGMGSQCNFGIRFATSATSVSNELHLVCSPVTTCDPNTQMPCTANDACVVSPNGPLCVPSGTVANGGACSNSMFCMRGSQCVVPASGGNTGTCRSLCKLDGGTPSCAAGTCQDLMMTGFGVCSM